MKDGKINGINTMKGGMKMKEGRRRRGGGGGGGA
jgi:hypothetical protein